MWTSPDLVDTKSFQIKYTKRTRRRPMNKRNYRKYTKEFKRDALELLKSSGKSGEQVERDLGITPGLLRKWLMKYQAVEKRGDGEEIGLELTDMEATKREIERLKRSIAELEQEREILKKALSIFSRNGR
jgi:transposase